MHKHLLALAAGAATLAFSTVAFAETNKVYLDQSQDGNDAVITQRGVSNSVGNADRAFTQRNQFYNPTAPAGYNDLIVNQTGSRNAVGDYSAQQQGLRNTATFTQRGNDNSVADFSQVGSRNEANITQRSNLNRVRQFYQFGANNTGTVSQNGIGNGGDYRSNNLPLPSTSSNFPAGTFSSGAADERLSIFEQRGTGNTGTVSATGNYNGFYLKQNGDRNTAEITQVGDSNFAYALQDVGNNNEIISNQRGSFNEVLAAQKMGNGNTLSVTQIGMGNISHTLQQGSANSAIISQSR